MSPSSASCLAKPKSFFFLASVVTKVFQQGHLTRLQRIDAAPRIVANAILDEMHLRAAHELGDLGRDRRK